MAPHHLLSAVSSSTPYVGGLVSLHGIEVRWRGCVTELLLGKRSVARESVVAL